MEDYDVGAVIKAMERLEGGIPGSNEEQSAVVRLAEAFAETIRQPSIGAFLEFDKIAEKVDSRIVVGIVLGGIAVQHVLEEKEVTR